MDLQIREFKLGQNFLLMMFSFKIFETPTFAK